MSTFRQRWNKLKNKKYREEFVAAQVKRGIPFQIRTLMKQLQFSQEELAKRANLSQGVVSRAADMNYGNLTLNTIIRVAAGFDLAFIGRFVPFSELDLWFTELSEASVRVKTFDEENANFERLNECESEDSIADDAPKQSSEQLARDDSGQKEIIVIPKREIRPGPQPLPEQRKFSDSTRGIPSRVAS